MIKGYSIKQIASIVLGHLDDMIEINGLEDDITINEVALFGSRVTAHDTDSDLDVAINYSGIAKEDEFHSVLNDDPLHIEGIRVDFSPFSIRKSGGSVYRNLENKIEIYEK